MAGEGSHVPKRIGLYARVSTEEQARDSDSLENQVSVCRRLVNTRWAGTETVIFSETGTARKTKRREYQRMMRYARQGLVDLVVCVEMSRLWRNLGDALRDMARLDEWSCAVHIMDIGIDTTTPVGRLQFALVGALAQFESDQVSARTKRALGELRQQGRKGPGRRPFGWKVTEAGMLERDDREQEAVDYIAARRDHGRTWREIAEELNLAGRPSATGREWDGGGCRLVYKAAVRRRGDELGRDAKKG